MPDDQLGPERSHFYMLVFVFFFFLNLFFRGSTVRRAKAWGWVPGVCSY